MSDFLSNQLSKSSAAGYIGQGMSLSVQALKLIMDYLLNPTLAGIVLYLEKYSKKIHSEVSKKKIINSSGNKLVVTDNIAPEPFAWNIEGYIKAEPYEMSNKFVPSLKQNRLKLENAVYSRTPIAFRDIDSTYFQVALEDIEFIQEPDNQNVLHFIAALYQTDVLSTTQSITDISSYKSQNVAGTADGESANMGSTDSTPGRAGSLLHYQVYGS
jgi:hypothetical protein